MSKEIDLSYLNIPYKTFKYLFDEKIGLYINGTPYCIERMIWGLRNHSVYGREIKYFDKEKFILQDKLDTAVKELEKVELWFSGMVGTLNNEYAEHNKSVPVGNFENALKQYAESINTALNQIKELKK